MNLKVITTGNRSPIADPRMRGSIVGLELASPILFSPHLSSKYSNFAQDSGLHDLAKKYYATLLSIALQTRHIIDSMNAKGHQITSIYMSGGQAKNLFLMQLFANTCKMPVVLPRDAGSAVVLGAAMLGRFAAEVEGAQAEKRKEMEGNGHAEALWDVMVSVTDSKFLSIVK